MIDNLFKNIKIEDTKNQYKLAKIISDIIKKKYYQTNKRVYINKMILEEIVIDPFFKILSSTTDCLKYIDFSEISFHNVDVRGIDFEGTNALIDPQLIWNKNLYSTSLKGLDMSDKDFKDVFLVYTNLEGTNANINPQKVRYKYLVGTNLKGLNMEGKDFNDVVILGSTLDNSEDNIKTKTLTKK